LAWSATEYDIHPPVAESGRDTDFASPQTLDRPGNDGAVREVELVRSAVHRVDLDGGYYVEPSLFEAEAHAPSAGEQINSDRPHRTLLSNLTTGTIAEHLGNVDRLCCSEKGAQSFFK
jgi:hypothetical protein